MAEGMGFEPTIRYNPYNGLANRRLQPLGHPSCHVYATLIPIAFQIPGALGLRSSPSVTY